jgi:4-hydroxy-tetrahydrodipicolinate reductase
VAAPALVIFGITGRMGQSLLRALREGSAFRLSGAVGSSASGRLGQDAASEGEPCGVSITDDCAAALHRASVALDFSMSGAVAAHARACAQRGVPLLVGTTGLDAATRGELASAALKVPVLIAPNTSVGVAVLHRLVSLACEALGPSFEVQISEAHHRLKRDAPSGTALSLGDAVAGARGVRLADVASLDGPGGGAPRAPGRIGFSVVRAGDIVGEHTVTLAAPGELLEITHRASDRMIFARGALKAAAWLLGRPAGLYGMVDVLGL